mmetsp:Transcript_10170/g.19529  ORF Transcript_10170/g.19529 Transcript_10170/m.19529 type:complete len:81 (-) Transcript_10170:133-375(-)|eukprot:scaffold3337_cov169-Amphora_coffeaeformis.AAC.36
MSEGGGITELQMLEQDVAILKTQLKGAEDADPSSVVGPMLLESIKAKETMDGFLVKEGGSDEVNQFHTAESADGGCCVVM